MLGSHDTTIRLLVIFDATKKKASNAETGQISKRIHISNPANSTYHLGSQDHPSHSAERNHNARPVVQPAAPPSARATRIRTVPPTLVPPAQRTNDPRNAVEKPETQHAVSQPMR
jgi:hypothetical protein